MKFLLTFLTALFLVISTCAQKPTTIITDSSKLQIRFNPASNTWLRHNTLNDSALTYVTELYADSLTIKKQGKRLYDSNIEKWHYFNAQGRNYLSIDYANLSRTLHDTVFQFQAYQDEIRQKADSIVCTYYSKAFFDRHIKLNANRSKWYSSHSNIQQQGLWFELFDSKPQYFEMAYLVMISPTMGFAYIYFTLDEDGELLESHANAGLHSVNRCCFQVNADRIKQIIRDSKLENPNDPGSEWALEWNEARQGFEIRISYTRFITTGDNPGLQSKSIYINPWNGTWRVSTSLEQHQR